jgi:hypothetical protein
MKPDSNGGVSGSLRKQQGHVGPRVGKQQGKVLASNKDTQMVGPQLAGIVPLPGTRHAMDPLCVPPTMGPSDPDACQWSGPDSRLHVQAHAPAGPTPSMALVPPPAPSMV